MALFGLLCQDHNITAALPNRGVVAEGEAIEIWFTEEELLLDLLPCLFLHGVWFKVANGAPPSLLKLPSLVGYGFPGKVQYASTRYPTLHVSTRKELLPKLRQVESSVIIGYFQTASEVEQFREDCTKYRKCGIALRVRPDVVADIDQYKAYVKPGVFVHNVAIVAKETSCTVSIVSSHRHAQVASSPGPWKCTFDRTRLKYSGASIPMFIGSFQRLVTMYRGSSTLVVL